MSEHFILTADDVAALGFSPDRLEAATVKPGKAIRPIRLAGDYAGRFALPASAARIVDQRTAAVLNTLPQRALNIGDFHWSLETPSAGTIAKARS